MDILLIFILPVLILYILLFFKKPKFIIAFSLIIIIIWPDYIVYKIGALPGLTLSRFILFFNLVLFLFFLFLSPKRNKKFLMKISLLKNLFVLLLVFLFWEFYVSIIGATYPVAALFSTINNFTTTLLLMLWIIYFFDNNKDINIILKALLLASIFVNIIGLVELQQGSNLFSNYLITKTETVLSAASGTTRSESYRLMSVFSNSLVYTQFLVLMLPLLLYMYKTFPSLYIKVIIFINFIISYIMIYHTGSRTGLALAILFPMILLYFNQVHKIKTRLIKKWLLVYIPISGAALIILLLLTNSDFFIQRLSDSESASSTLARIVQLEKGSVVILQQPFLGYGSGQALVPMYPMRSIDNYFLTVTLEMGLIGLFLYLAMLITVLLKMIYFASYHEYNIRLFTISIFLILYFYLFLSIDKVNTLIYVMLAILFVKVYAINTNFKKNKILRIGMPYEK